MIKLRVCLAKYLNIRTQTGEDKCTFIAQGRNTKSIIDYFAFSSEMNNIENIRMEKSVILSIQYRLVIAEIITREEIYKIKKMKNERERRRSMEKICDELRMKEEKKEDWGKEKKVKQT